MVFHLASVLFIKIVSLLFASRIMKRTLNKLNPFPFISSTNDSMQQDHYEMWHCILRDILHISHNFVGNIV